MPHVCAQEGGPPAAGAGGAADCPPSSWREQLLSAGDMDSLWAFWTWAAEVPLLVLASPALQPRDVHWQQQLPAVPAPLKCGRGTAAILKEVRQYPQQDRSTTGPKTSVLAQMHAAQGPIMLPATAAVPAPAASMGAVGSVVGPWVSLQRRLQRLHRLRPPGLDGFPLGPAQVALADTTALGAAELDERLLQLKRLARL